MKLLPSEEKLVTSNQDKIVLTTHRISMTDIQWGQSFSISIFLEDISSIEVKYKSNILYVVLCALSVLGGLYFSTQHSGSQSLMVGLLVAGIFFALWWFSRKHIISIAPNGGSSLNFVVEGMNDEKVADFIYNVSFAKRTRVNQLSNL